MSDIEQARKKRTVLERLASGISEGMTDRLSRAIVDRLVALREIAIVFKSVIAEDATSCVTFAEVASVIGPRLYRAPSPALYRDIRQVCRMLGIVTTTMHGGFRVVRGVKLR